MVNRIISGGINGIEGYTVNVETDISDGMPMFDMVGSLAGEVREARDRVRAALKNSGYSLPVKRITVNLSPANMKKYGTGYDLPIAVSILLGLGAFPSGSIEGVFFAGELMLSGEVRGINGILPMVINARAEGIKKCVIPSNNLEEGQLVTGIDIVGVENVLQLIRYLKGEEAIETVGPEPFEEDCDVKYDNDMSEINGQHFARRGLEIAASGYHNILMVGPPGCGKSLLAKCIPSIMPPLTGDERMKIYSVYSVGGILSQHNKAGTRRPFVSPHNSTSDISLIGGGVRPRPGAVSYASKGVLFMDEFPEFSRNALEALRIPLEDRKVCISRNMETIEYPADFMLVAAMNPCPCGMYPDMNKCVCSSASIKKYLSRISRPLLDRIDIYIGVDKLDVKDMMIRKADNESSELVRKRVEAAHNIQKERFRNDNIQFNSQMDQNLIRKYCELGREEEKWLEAAAGRLDISARAYFRILRVARTIADMDSSENIDVYHLSEAFHINRNFRDNLM